MFIIYTFFCFVLFCPKNEIFCRNENEKRNFQWINEFVCLFVMKEMKSNKKKEKKTKKIDNFKHSTISRREPATFESIRMIIIRVMKRRQEKDENWLVGWSTEWWKACANRIFENKMIRKKCMFCFVRFEFYWFEIFNFENIFSLLFFMILKHPHHHW